MLHFSDINGVTTTVIITEEMKVTVSLISSIQRHTLYIFVSIYYFQSFRYDIKSRRIAYTY